MSDETLCNAYCILSTICLQVNKRVCKTRPITILHLSEGYDPSRLVVIERRLDKKPFVCFEGVMPIGVSNLLSPPYQGMRDLFNAVAWIIFAEKELALFMRHFFKREAVLEKLINLIKSWILGEAFLLKLFGPPPPPPQRKKYVEQKNWTKNARLLMSRLKYLWQGLFRKKAKDKNGK